MASCGTTASPPSANARRAWRSPPTPTGCPDAVRAALRGLISHLSQSVPVTSSFGLPPLGAAVGAFDDQTLTGKLIVLLSGSWQERGDAAMLIGHRGLSEFTAALTALLGDPHPEVRTVPPARSRSA